MYIKKKFQLVIGNLLHTRKRHVKLINQNGDVEDIVLTENNVEKGIEIEDLIIMKIKAKHDAFIKDKEN